MRVIRQITIGILLYLTGWIVGYVNGYDIPDTTDVRNRIRYICLLDHSMRGGEFCSLVYDTMSAEDNRPKVFKYLNK